MSEDILEKKNKVISNYRIINNVSYSKREMDCLYLLIRGMTAKQIARQLNLSPRTVEAYLTHIKIKAGVLTKSALINKMIDYLHPLPIKKENQSR